MNDDWRLERFVAAQDQDGTYQRAVAELRAGAKASHWMWFVFPQIEGLGMSAMSRQYAISSVAEARAYLAHPVLGPRLRECARIVAGTTGRSAQQVFGSVDAMKLRSSMTLFAAAEAGEAEAGAAEAGEAEAGDAGPNVFRTVLARFFDGVPDEETVARLLSPPRRGVTARGRGEAPPTPPGRGIVGPGAPAPRCPGAPAPRRPRVRPGSGRFSPRRDGREPAHRAAAAAVAARLGEREGAERRRRRERARGRRRRRAVGRHAKTSCQRPPRRTRLAACPGPRRSPTASSSRPSRASARCSRPGWTSTARRCSPSAPA